MRLAFCILLLPTVLFGQVFPPAFWGVAPPAAASGITADFWQDFEFTTMNTGNLDAHDHNAGGTWSITDTATQLATGTGAQHTMLSTVNGTTDTGARGLVYTANNASAAFLQYQYSSAPNANAVSFGMWILVPSSGSDCNSKFCTFYNVVAIRARKNGATYTIGWDDNSGEITITADNWYWVTTSIQKSATCKLRVYNASGVQVGSETTFAGRANDMTHLMIANLDGGNFGVTLNIDNVVFDQTSHVYPLGP